jgi:hypothetical protein
MPMLIAAQAGEVIALPLAQKGTLHGQGSSLANPITQWFRTLNRDPARVLLSFFCCGFEKSAPKLSPGDGRACESFSLARNIVLPR